jgi:hypothetical protein
VILFRVVDPIKAVNNVESYLESTFQYAQTTLRSVLGSAELDTVLSEREALNRKIQDRLDLAHLGVNDLRAVPEQLAERAPDLFQAGNWLASWCGRIKRGHVIPVGFELGRQVCF